MISSTQEGRQLRGRSRLQPYRNALVYLSRLIADRLPAWPTRGLGQTLGHD